MTVEEAQGLKYGDLVQVWPLHEQAAAWIAIFHAYYPHGILGGETCVLVQQPGHRTQAVLADRVHIIRGGIPA